MSYAVCSDVDVVWEECEAIPEVETFQAKEVVHRSSFPYLLPSFVVVIVVEIRDDAKHCKRSTIFETKMFNKYKLPPKPKPKHFFSKKKVVSKVTKVAKSKAKISKAKVMGVFVVMSAEALGFHCVRNYMKEVCGEDIPLPPLM